MDENVKSDFNQDDTDNVSHVIDDIYKLHNFRWLIAFLFYGTITSLKILVFVMLILFAWTESLIFFQLFCTGASLIAIFNYIEWFDFKMQSLGFYGSLKKNKKRVNNIKNNS